MKNSLYIVLLCFLGLIGCGQKNGAEQSQPESRQAKQMLQGVWVDEESEELVFRAKGDSVYYPDTITMPAYFRIYGDSLYMNSAQYLILKQSPHVFWFENLNGDVVKLRKSTETTDEQMFGKQKTKVLQITEMTRRDTVVFYDGQRYHCYIDISPTKYKVEHSSYNSGGVEVNNVYYDNIIHLSIYRGADRLFSKDIRKQHYQMVPQGFLEQAVLGNMMLRHVDSKGFHFHATLCIPDGASCYQVETIISHTGKMSMHLLED